MPLPTMNEHRMSVKFVTLLRTALLVALGFALPWAAGAQAINFSAPHDFPAPINALRPRG